MIKHPFELSEQTRRLVLYMSQQQRGAEVSYSDLSVAAGMIIDPRSGFLASARRILERDHAQVWVCIQPRIGLRRLDDVDLAKRLQGHWLNGARRKLDRGGKQAEFVEIARLDINQQTGFAVDCIQRSLAMDALSRATRKKMERVARGSGNDLPTFSAIEWMITLSPNRKGRTQY